MDTKEARTARWNEALELALSAVREAARFLADDVHSLATTLPQRLLAEAIAGGLNDMVDQVGRFTARWEV
jgi:hypothetical protein